MPEPVTSSITEVFYLVSSLIPEEQQPAMIPHDMPVLEAIEYMEEKGYSQLPVISWSSVIGVFSYRSFSKGVLEIELEPYESITELSVGDFVERLRFADENDNWESILRIIKRDGFILIGNRTSTRKIITSTDIINFLHRVGKPFVVLAEIELSLRRVIENCVNVANLEECFQNGLSQYYAAEKMPALIVELNFNDYVQIIGDSRNWQYFKPFFGHSPGLRKRTRNALKQVGELRNDAFHFRRHINDEDTHYLNTKRIWLHRRAMIFEDERRKAAIESVVQAEAN